MKVYFIGAGPGDPELITVKGKKIIERSGYCIYAGSLVNPDILKYCSKDARKYDSASMTLEEIIAVMEEAKAKNEDVARVHTGDPSIYGAIQEQMLELDKRGIDYEIVPGVSSFLAAASTLKQELTLPGVSQTVIITRIEGNTPVPETEGLEILAKSKATLCIFLSIKEINKVVDILKPVYGAYCPVAIVYKASWKDEKVIISNLNDVVDKTIQNGIKKTAIIIVGDVLSKNFEYSKLYDKHFKHSYRNKS
ncbi:MAG: precorrin-4 C11-methyltransferase [Candidatus Scalindua rubra]|uniref:Precorrin-4 C11-methyltransferase n=1 Tax=Candidatus Scalindua rubra TaxID=1872076 RepID=A0A1E3XGA5_9BACT|nr:MAG: precorrin-4 C11-methyltransferase [Candidatus Scalindua rubra]